MFNTSCFLPAGPSPFYTRPSSTVCERCQSLRIRKDSCLYATTLHLIKLAMNFPITTSSSAPVATLPSQIQGHSGLSTVSEINKIRDLAEQIRQRCSHAHLAVQQQSVSFQVNMIKQSIDSIIAIVWVKLDKK